MFEMADMYKMAVAQLCPHYIRMHGMQYVWHRYLHTYTMYIYMHKVKIAYQLRSKDRLRYDSLSTKKLAN